MTRSPQSFSVLFLGLILSFSAGCPEEEDDGHGVVKVQFFRAESEDASPFLGTQELVVTLNYQSCLIEFYGGNPNYAHDGVDGGPIFQEYADNGADKGLCNRTDSSDPIINCDVNSIEQDLDNNRLTVRYNVMEMDMESMAVFFGPLPCEKLTVCNPVVEVSGSSATGLSGETVVWRTASFPVREAACGQNLPIQINAQKP